MEIIAIIVFAILFIREWRKKRENPNYHSWIDDDSVKTFRGPDDEFFD